MDCVMDHGTFGNCSVPSSQEGKFRHSDETNRATCLQPPKHPKAPHKVAGARYEMLRRQKADADADSNPSP